MGARTRLNSLYVMSASATAALVGAAMSSWSAFFIVLMIGLGLMFSDSRIRMNPVRRLRTVHRWKSRRHYR